MLNYGEALAYQREINNLSQNQLAKKMGTSHANISRWEANKSLPSIDFCVQLADFYGITLDELVGRNLPQEKYRTEIHDNHGNITFHQK